MKKIKYLIIGGGVTATTAASEISQKDKQGEILILGEEEYYAYSRVRLPHYIKDIIPRQTLFLNPDSFYQEQNINFERNKKVVLLDEKEKTVELEDGEKIGFEKLLIATGGSPRKWEVEGADLPGVLRLNTIDDAEKIKEHISDIQHAAVVAGGFIGLEFAGILGLRKIPGTILVREPWYWKPILDQPSGEILKRRMEQNGLKVLENSEILKILGKEKVEAVALKSGEKISCQMVGVGIGIEPNLNFIKSGSFKVDNGLWVNQYLETNIPGIYAAGDCANFYDLVFRRNHRLGNWLNATRQGKIAGENMAGGKEQFNLVSAYSIMCLGLPVTFLGDVFPDEKNKIINRGPEGDNYVRIITRENKVVGATLLGSVKDREPLNQLIGKKIDISGREKELGNLSFNLGELLN